MTLLMGLYARLPFAVAPGMGLNAFFAYTIVLQGKVPWQTALGIVFWAGVLFLLVSATPLRERIALAIPPSLRAAAAAGIGLLLTFIGLHNAGSSSATRRRWCGWARSITARRAAARHPRRGGADAPEQSARLPRRRSRGHRAGWTLGYAKPPDTVVSAPDFSSAFLKLDIRGALQAGAAAGDRRDSLHRSLRLALDVHRRRQRGRPDRRRGRPINLRGA